MSYKHDRFPEARSFSESHVSRHYRVEYFGSEVLASVGDNLSREVEAGVVHGEEDAVDSERGIDGLLDPVDRVEQLGESFKCVVFALDRDEDCVCGGEHVDGQQAERGWTVDEDVVVAIAKGRDGVPHGELTILAIDQLDLSACEVWGGRRDVQMGELDGAKDYLIEWDLSDEGVVDRSGKVLDFDSDAAGCIPLRVAIDQQRSLLCDCQACCEVDGGGGLTDATLLICNRDYLGHALLGSGMPRNIDPFDARGYRRFVDMPPVFHVKQAATPQAACSGESSGLMSFISNAPHLPRQKAANSLFYGTNESPTRQYADIQ